MKDSIVCQEDLVKLRNYLPLIPEIERDILILFYYYNEDVLTISQKTKQIVAYIQDVIAKHSKIIEEEF